MPTDPEILAEMKEAAANLIRSHRLPQSVERNLVNSLSTLALSYYALGEKAVKEEIAQGRWERFQNFGGI